MLKVGRHEFEIAQATFAVHVGVAESGWTVSWSLDVVGAPREIEGQRWRPKLKCHTPLTGLPTPDRLSGKSLGPLNDDEDGEPVFMLSIFEHESVRDVRLHIKEQKGDLFRLELTGLTPSWDEKEAARVKVLVSCWLPLEAIVDEHLETKARERLEIELPKQNWGSPTVKLYKQSFPWRGLEA